jgi:transcriptional antiterminator NusG
VPAQNQGESNPPSQPDEKPVETAAPPEAAGIESAQSESSESESAESESAEPEQPLDKEIRAEDIASDADFLDDDEDEDAAPIEEMVEEQQVVAESPDADGLSMNWYILKVQVNREKSICDALQRRVKLEGMEKFFGETEPGKLDILVPTEDVREFAKSGKQRIIKRKLYPGYVVVRMAITDDTWFLVRDTPGIGDFTGAAGKPAPLSQEEIDRIVATTRPPQDQESEEPVKTAIRFKIDDRVRVKEGYFQNYEGEVSNVDERNGRVTVMINIFGRPNPVELDHWQVEDV